MKRPCNALNAVASRFNLATLAPMLEDVRDRLQSVTIERLPYLDFLARYDRPGTLFYLDPPYWGCERDYGPGFERADFERLRDASTPKLRPTTLPPNARRWRYRNRAERSKSVKVDGSIRASRSNSARLDSCHLSVSRNA